MSMHAILVKFKKAIQGNVVHYTSEGYDWCNEVLALAMQTRYLNFSLPQCKYQKNMSAFKYLVY